MDTPTPESTAGEETVGESTEEAMIGTESVL